MKALLFVGVFLGVGGGSFLSDSNNIDDTYPLISSSNSEVVVECRLMV